MSAVSNTRWSARNGGDDASDCVDSKIASSGRLATAWRHFKDRKPHLVEQDLAALEAMPAMTEGDRPAFLAALRVSWHLLRDDAAAARQAADAVIERVGPYAAGVLVNSVAEMARIGLRATPDVALPDPPDPRAVADADARTIRLAEDLKLWGGPQPPPSSSRRFL